jgi:hypothetical protein
MPDYVLEKLLLSILLILRLGDDSDAFPTEARARLLFDEEMLFDPLLTLLAGDGDEVLARCIPRLWTQGFHGWRVGNMAWRPPDGLETLLARYAPGQLD